MKERKFNLKRTINEELRKGKSINESSSVNLQIIMETLDECIDSLELELTDIELTEQNDRSIPILQECLNYIYNTRSKLKKL